MAGGDTGVIQHGNGRHIFEVQHSTINGKLGYYNICKNCSMSAGEVLEPAYQEQVSELPAQTYNSDGSLLVVPSHNKMYERHTVGAFGGSSAYYFLCEHCNSSMSESASSSFNHKLDCPNSSVVLSIKSGASNFTFDSVYNYFIFTTSIDGYYSLFREPALSGFYLDGEQNRFSLDSLRSSFYPQISGCVFYSAGKEFSPYLWYSPPNSSTKFSYFFISVIPPVYKVEPFDPESGTVGESYTPDTRPTVITGDYGIVDNQGVATVIKDCTIVNETTNNYYNPDTGQLVQEGYTIYECSRCGEQNKTTSGAGPPPSGGGDAPGGEEDASIWDKLGDLLGTLITGISGLLGSVLGKLLEALLLFSLLLAFVSACFRILKGGFPWLR